MTPTVPMGSFIAMAIFRNGGLCTAPSNLSAHAAYEKMRSMPDRLLAQRLILLLLMPGA